MQMAVATRVCSLVGSERLGPRSSCCRCLVLPDGAGLAQAADALPFSKGFLVTGNYAVGGVDVDPKTTANGVVTGTVSMSGVPANAEILAAYLYWEMISTDIAQVNGARFRGSPVTVVKASSTPLNPSTSACWSSGGGGGATYTMTMFRADVLRLLPVQLDASGSPTGHRLVNDADLLAHGFSALHRDASIGGRRKPGAVGCRRDAAGDLSRSLAAPDEDFPVRRHLCSGARRDDEPDDRGFFQSSPAEVARMTQIVGSGAPNSTDRLYFNGSRIASDPFVGTNTPQSDRAWSNPTYDVSSLMPGTDLHTGYGEQVTTRVDHTKSSPYDCLAWAAVVFSARLRTLTAMVCRTRWRMSAGSWTRTAGRCRTSMPWAPARATRTSSSNSAR